MSVWAIRDVAERPHGGTAIGNEPGARFAPAPRSKMLLYPRAATALPTSVLPSDQIAPGTRWVAAITLSNAPTIQSQSASVMTSGHSSLMVWLACPATWVRILCSANNGMVINWQNSPLLADSSRFQLALSFNEVGGPNSMPIISPLPRTARKNS